MKKLSLFLCSVIVLCFFSLVSLKAQYVNSTTYNTQQVGLITTGEYMAEAPGLSAEDLEDLIEEGNEQSEEQQNETEALMESKNAVTNYLINIAENFLNWWPW